MIAGTAQAWLEAIVSGRSWDRDRDEPRFEQAFVTLARTAKRWPTVAEFLEAVPQPPPQPRLIRPTNIPETRADRCARMKVLFPDLYNAAVEDPAYEPQGQRRRRPTQGGEGVPT